METAGSSKFSIALCYSKAWRAFSKWWIPLCLVSGLLIVFELGPKQLAKAESSAIGKTITQFIEALKQNDLDQINLFAVELHDASWTYLKTVATFTLYAAPIMAILTIILLCTSIMAVNDQRIHYSPGWILWVSFLNIFVATIKISLLFLCLPLGIYIYIKLYFCSLIMVDEKQGLREAIRQSWKLSSGYFWPLLGMVVLNSILQIMATPTLIGLIPASGFATTTRASAFKLLQTHLVDEA